MLIISVRSHEIDKLKKKAKIKITKEQGGDHTVIFSYFSEYCTKKRRLLTFKTKFQLNQ